MSEESMVDCNGCQRIKPLDELCSHGYCEACIIRELDSGCPTGEE